MFAPISLMLPSGSNSDGLPASMHGDNSE